MTKGTANKEFIRVRGYIKRRSSPGPKAIANLRPPVKGEIRNPLGRPHKDISITSILKELLQVPTTELPWPKETLTWGQALALSWVKRAMTEEGPFNTLLDRVEGKIPISVNIHAELERVALEMGLPVAEVEAEYQKVVKLLPSGK